MNKLGTHKRSRGFSLIELMLAMVIGLVIIGGVMKLYISSRNTQRTSQDQLKLVSDANFVIETIGEDLRLAGYWGDASVTNSIVCRSGDASCTGSALPNATGDCASGWYTDLTDALTVSDNTSNYTSTCTPSYLANTDVVGVHYADPNPVLTANLAANTAYLRSNYDLGGLFVASAAGTVPTSGAYSGLKYWNPSVATNATKTTNHLLAAHLYYISKDTVAGDGIPSLHLVQLENGPVMTDKMLISGVADLQVQLGVDTSPNTPITTCVADSYVNPGNVPVNSTTGATDWNRVCSAKIWVLVRSDNKDLDVAAPAQVFTLANHTDTVNDGHRYYMMSSIVQLRNNK